MSKRKIIVIDQDKCNGCRECIPNCPEGALQIIDGKARLVSDLFCDGLGACIGHCPQGAINIEEREAGEYDERRVMENITGQGENVIKAHLEHLRSRGQSAYFQEAVSFLKQKGIPVPGFESKVQEQCRHGGCPGARAMDLGATAAEKDASAGEPPKSQLRQWPVQLMLVPVNAPYFQGADILIAADCVPFAYPDFHNTLLSGKILLVGCPKLDNLDLYRDKIGRILKSNEIRSLTYAHMEVPCCFGLKGGIRDSLSACGKNIPFKDITISIKGEIIREEPSDV